MKMMHALWVAALSLGVATSAAAQKVPGVTNDSVTIGTTNPQTGPVASVCKPVVDGSLAWIDKVNADGGVHGRKIVNKVMDDQYTAPQALANARELAELPVFAFFGGCGSFQPPAIQQVAKPENIPYVFPNAGVAEVTNDPNYRVLQPLFADQFQGLNEWALKKHGAGTVFLVNQRIASMEENRAAQIEGIKAGGGTVVGSEVTVANEPDYTPLVLKIKAVNPDYVLFATGPADAARILQAMNTQGALPKKFILGNSALVSTSFLSPIGDLANGKVLAAQLALPASSPKAKTCIDAFAKFNPALKADTQNLFGCAMAQALVAALQDAGKDLTREGFMKAIDSWKEKSVSDLLPPLTFAGNRHIGMPKMTVAGVANRQLEEIPGEFLPVKPR